MAIRSQGTTIEVSADPTADPIVYTALGETATVNGIGGGEATVIDTSHLGSTAKEKLIGLQDEGQAQLEMNLVPDDAGQVIVRNARSTSSPIAVKVTFTDSAATELTFIGVPKSFEVGIATDEKVSASSNVEITGAVTWA